MSVRGVSGASFVRVSSGAVRVEVPVRFANAAAGWALLKELQSFSVLEGAVKDFFSNILTGKDPQTAQREANELVRRSNAMVKQIRSALPSLSASGLAEAKELASSLSTAAASIKDSMGVKVYANVDWL